MVCRHKLLGSDMQFSQDFTTAFIIIWYPDTCLVDVGGVEGSETTSFP